MPKCLHSYFLHLCSNQHKEAKKKEWQRLNTC
nr:MAG TPA: hypothetical protein [Caudoviricetes sp.]